MYLVDSDVLIDAKNRHYGFDIVPAFWDWLGREHQAGKVFVVQRVADEVLAGADELAAGMKAQPASFKLAPTAGADRCRRGVFDIRQPVGEQRGLSSGSCIGVSASRRLLQRGASTYAHIHGDHTGKA